jgi:phosphopantetheinyl transferase
MPLYKTINPNSQTVVKIWKITETYTALMDGVSLEASSLNRVLGMKSELHQRGFLAVRWLLATFGYSDKDVFYDTFGKPHLADGKYISITHSFNFAAVVVSKNTVGIDLEKQREKIKVIAHKFIDYEFSYLENNANDYIRKLTVVWCIKESLYKLFGTPGLSFKANCLAIPFNLEDEATVAWIDYNTKKYRYEISFLEFEGFTCAYALT